jgi:hypothetical protein
MRNIISFETLEPMCLITSCQDPEEHDTSVVFRHSDVQFMSKDRRQCRTEEEYRLDHEHFLRNPLQLTIHATVQSYIAGVTDSAIKQTTKQCVSASGQRVHQVVLCAGFRTVPQNVPK